MNRSEILPKISIITAVWNNLPGLKMTACSIADQNWPEVEHIVIDGASIDGTGDWLRSYAPNYTTRSVSEADAGIYDAMNKGGEMASGEVLLFLNGGDVLSNPGVLRQVADEFRRSKSQWGYGGINYINEQREVVGSYVFSPFRPRNVELGLAYYPHPAAFFSRDLFQRLGGYREGFGWSADQELMVRAARISTPVVWTEPLTDFAVGGAHSQGSLLDVAKRYGSIRTRNGYELGGSALLDAIYTRALGNYWSGRAFVGRLLRRPSGIDTVRKD